MVSGRVDRRLAAILAADVAGYSRLMSADEIGTFSALKAHRSDAIDPTIAAHKGRIVKTTGDGILVEFSSAIEAVACALDIQKTMSERNRDIPPDQRIDFRIGINVGDIIVDGGDVFGDGVNIAARLEGPAEPGGIYLSRAVHEQVAGKVAAAFTELRCTQPEEYRYAGPCLRSQRGWRRVARFSCAAAVFGAAVNSGAAFQRPV